MAVEGLDIFKLSPKTNCKECGCQMCIRDSADTALCGRSVFLDGDAPTMWTRIDVFRFLVIFLFRPYCLRPEYQFVQLVSRQTIQGAVLHDVAEKFGHEKDTPFHGIFCARSIFGACPSTVGDVPQHNPLLDVKRSLLVLSCSLL